MKQCIHLFKCVLTHLRPSLSKERCCRYDRRRSTALFGLFLFTICTIYSWILEQSWLQLGVVTDDSRAINRFRYAWMWCGSLWLVDTDVPEQLSHNSGAEVMTWWTTIGKIQGDWIVPEQLYESTIGQRSTKVNGERYPRNV